MVNNSANINKTKYHHAPEAIEQKRPWHKSLKIQILADNHKGVAGLSQLIGSQLPPLVSWI
jgi:hypothetical protein